MTNVDGERFFLGASFDHPVVNTWQTCSFSSCLGSLLRWIDSISIRYRSGRRVVNSTVYAKYSCKVPSARLYKAQACMKLGQQSSTLSLSSRKDHGSENEIPIFLFDFTPTVRKIDRVTDTCEKFLWNLN